MIYTVNGPISKEELGLTLGHEHFKWEYIDEYANQMYFEKKYKDEDIEKSHQVLLPVMKELYQYKCRAIVEASPPIGGQNVKLLKKLSTDSNIHIIPSTGWNVPSHIYDMFTDTFEEKMAKRWIHDFEEGLDTIDGIKIRPGYIKLLLNKGKLSDHDKALLKAAVKTSKRTGLPIQCHILEYEMVYDVIKLLEQENADMSKFLWSHADQEGHEDTIRFAYEKGIWIGFDMIQPDKYEEKIRYIKFVLKEGYGDKVLLSQDDDFYNDIMKNGNNHECTSLFKSFMPICEEKGIKRQVLEEMMTRNPAAFYDIE